MTSARQALAALGDAYANPSAIADRLLGAGHKIVRTLGSDIPTTLIRAAGFVPVRLAAGAVVATPLADAVVGRGSLSTRGRLLLDKLLDPAMADVPILITRADSEQPQIFAALRERARLGEAGPRNVHFLDLLHLDRLASRRYNRLRLEQLAIWLAEIGGNAVDDAMIATVGAKEEISRRQAFAVNALRRADPARLSGLNMLHVTGSAAILPTSDYQELLQAILDDAASLATRNGARLYLTGSVHEADTLYAAIESTGATVVGEDHSWGEQRLDNPVPDTMEGLADPARLVPLAMQTAADRAAMLFQNAQASGAGVILHLSFDADEAAPWDIAAMRRAVEGWALKFIALKSPFAGGERFTKALHDAMNDVVAAPPAVKPKLAKSAPAPAPKRSRKSLSSVATFGTYQREWFASVRTAVAKGAPFAMVNANAPQEILRALDIPFVVNQWWASIVAAKQQSGRYRGLLRDHNFPTDVEAYSAQGLAAAFDKDAELAPWGGLPTPDFLFAIASSDPTARIFEEWALATGAEAFIYERTVDPRWHISTRWWDDLPDRWDEALESERLDVLVAELEIVIARLEAKTGRTLSRARLEEVMHLVNEQEDYYRRTRDLIATTIPAPIGIVDSMPATMVPQWHRGTVWARDAAKAFYEEVADRAAAGTAAVPDERVRLMWVGRGLWSDMSFYQSWEESHGAVFVWSMYLALAADGYIRNFDRGRDPLRALAARFLTMGDELRMPSWAGPWHVEEAQTNAIDGAVAASDADPFVLRALVAAGIPVLELGVDNFALEQSDTAALNARITDFVTGPAAARAAVRRGTNG